MENVQLSPELERIERLLAVGPRPKPSAALRQRVLADVHEIRWQCVLDGLRQQLLREQTRSSWRFAAVCAATFLLALSLSLGVMHETGFTLHPPRSAPTVYDIARQIQQLSPAVTKEDAIRQAMLRHVGAQASGAAPNNAFFAEAKSNDH
jgi:hypothetical protein